MRKESNKRIKNGSRKVVWKREEGLNDNSRAVEEKQENKMNAADGQH